MLSFEERFNYYIKNWKNKQIITIPNFCKNFVLNELYFYQGPHITHVDNFTYNYGILSPGWWWDQHPKLRLDIPCLTISSDGHESKGYPALVKERYINDVNGGILWPAEYDYAWNNTFNNSDFINYEKKSTPWENKINDVIWRGSPTGIQESNKNKRILLCEKYIDKYNIGIISTWDRWPSYYLKEKTSIIDMLKYKYQISIEGNGYATDLKWKLASNSIVLMIPPILETWAMEGLLKPYVHYIPLKDDYSDLAEILDWCKQNDDKCKEIVNNANVFMKQFEDFNVETELFNLIKEYYKNTFTFI